MCLKYLLKYDFKNILISQGLMLLLIRIMHLNVDYKRTLSTITREAHSSYYDIHSSKHMMSWDSCFHKWWRRLCTMHIVVCSSSSSISSRLAQTKKEDETYLSVLDGIPRKSSFRLQGLFIICPWYDSHIQSNLYENTN